MAKFADGTEVPVERSRAELEALLQRHKATATAVFTSRDQAAVCFEMHERRVMFRLRLPDPASQEFTHGRINQTKALHRLSDAAAQKRWEGACRRKWRALVLAIKAKLVSVEEGIETFEEAFMAHVVMPDGSTVADNVAPRIANAYRDQRMVPLLPPPKAK